MATKQATIDRLRSNLARCRVLADGGVWLATVPEVLELLALGDTATADQIRAVAATAQIKVELFKNDLVRLSLTTPVMGGVAEVFRYWQDKTGHKGAKLSRPRRDKIRQRLAEGYTVDQLKQAIDGLILSDWHMGRTETGVVYDDVDLVCRSAVKVDWFIALAKNPPKGGRKGRPAQAPRFSGVRLPYADKDLDQDQEGGEP